MDPITVTAATGAAKGAGSAAGKRRPRRRTSRCPRPGCKLQLPSGGHSDTRGPAPQTLDDSEKGRWHAATLTSDYRLDLDGRRLQRRPCVAGPKFIQVGTREIVVRRTFDIDTSWVRLEELVQCHVLLPLLSRIEHPRRGLQPLSSTLVKSVAPLRDNEAW
jgi:hypothetical protein